MPRGIKKFPFFNVYMIMIIITTWPDAQKRQYRV